MASRYEIDGRLADVIAAVTVLAAAKGSEGTLRMWANRLSRPNDNAAIDQSVDHWNAVFNDHPEFFLVYEWDDEVKAALRLRYANKTIDRATGLQRSTSTRRRRSSAVNSRAHRSTSRPPVRW